MAKIVEQHITIKISKLAKDESSEKLEAVNGAVITDLLGVLEQLINDPSCIIEAE